MGIGSINIQTPPSFINVSLSVNGSNCYETFSGSQNKRDQVYRAAAFDLRPIYEQSLL